MTAEIINLADLRTKPVVRDDRFSSDDQDSEETTLILLRNLARKLGLPPLMEEKPRVSTVLRPFVDQDEKGVGITDAAKINVLGAAGAGRGGESTP
jgi:hypothetical protein